MNKILTYIAAVVLLTGCNGKAQTNVETVPPKTFAEKLKSDPQPQLIDVRTPEEFSGERIENATNINWNGDNFETDAAKLDKSRPVYVYCKIGGRSAQAASKLHDMGFSQVYDLQGGILKWNAEGLSKPSGKEIGITKDDFEKLTKSGDKVLVSFYAEWCAPCKKMAPYMAKLQENESGVKIVRLDADKNKTMISEMKIDELPTLLLFEQGKLSWQHKGFISESDLKKQLQ